MFYVLLRKIDKYRKIHLKKALSCHQQKHRITESPRGTTSLRVCRMSIHPPITSKSTGLTYGCIKTNQPNRPTKQRKKEKEGREERERVRLAVTSKEG